MGFRFRKSVKVAPGVRLNVGSKSAGVSFGGKGLRYSINSRAGSRVTASIPGTGISFTSSGSTPRRRTKAYLRQSELKMMRRQYEKMHELQRAKYEVEVYQNHIDVIHSIHKQCEDTIDWMTIERSTAPYINGEIGQNQLTAKNTFDTYKPSFFDKVFKRVEKKRNALHHNIILGKLEDEATYKAWEETVSLGKRVNNADSEAYLQVIEEMNPFEDISDFGSGFKFFVYKQSNCIVIEFDVNSLNIVPKYEKTLTKTGKLSVKELTKTKYYDLLQDYVCSCVIRIARDLFAILPVKQVIVQALDEQINTSTGYLETVTILSVRITREKFNTMNFDHIDCSDALSSFEHNMKFVKSSGFKAVSQIVMS